VLKPFLRTVPDALIANSLSTLTAVLDGEHVVHRSRRYVIPSATRVISDAVRQVEPTPGSPQRTSFRVGIVGRIAPWKGQDVFLDAFARAYPDGDERAVVVGSPMFGEDDYLAGLHAQADRLGLDGRVEFTGFVEDVNGVLADLDVLVHASVTAEPFGQVVIEGLAAGVPVIAADDGGPAEILHDGVDGLAVPARRRRRARRAARRGAGGRGPARAAGRRRLAAGAPLQPRAPRRRRARRLPLRARQGRSGVTPLRILVVEPNLDDNGAMRSSIALAERWRLAGHQVRI
jgi:glycosyltransferase involved in cell wall biosynthesis